MIINGWETMNPDKDLESSLKAFLKGLINMWPDDAYGPTLEAPFTIKIELPFFRSEITKYLYWKSYVSREALRHGFELIDAKLENDHLTLWLK